MGSLIIVASIFAAPNPNSWELVNEEDGIKIFRREVAGSDIAEAKAEIVINQPAERVWQVVTNNEKFVEFMPYMEEVRIMGTEGKYRFIYYRIDPPFVDEREYTLRVHDEISEGLWIRRWSLADDKGPPKRDDCVHLKVSNGSWTIKRLGERKTHLTYWVFTDSGGSVPTWIANKANSMSLPDLMHAVASRAANPSWKRDD